jgi:hypothetical protein
MPGGGGGPKTVPKSRGDKVVYKKSVKAEILPHPYLRKYSGMERYKALGSSEKKGKG